MCHRCSSLDVNIDCGYVDNQELLCWRFKSLMTRFWRNHNEIKVVDMLRALPEQLCPNHYPPDRHTSSSKSSFHSSSSSSSSSSDLRPFPFCLEKKGVRVLLYRECDRRGRKLLYDSQTVLRMSIPESPTHPQCSSRLFRTPLSARSGVGQHISSQAISRSTSSSIHFKSSSLSNSCSVSAEKSFRSSAGGATTLRHLNRHSDKRKSSAGEIYDRRKSSTGDVYVEVRNGYGYQYLKEACDTKQIGELVFGSVALAFKGASAKLHLMKEPSRILMSRTCRAPRSYRSPQTSCDTGIEDSFSSLSTSLSEAQLSKVESLESSCSKPLLKPSLPLEMYPAGGFGGVKACLSEEDSGFSGPPSPFSSTCGSYLNPASLPCTPMGTPSSRSGSGSSLKSSGSLSSLQRRFLRNVATSLESFGFASIDEDNRDENRLPSYQTKLGLAVIIETKQESLEIEKQAEEWWFNQQEVLDNLMNKLQAALEIAYLHRGNFVSSVYEAVFQLQQELEDFIYAPRLSEPLWLSLLGADSDKTRERLHSRLIDSLSYLLNNYDTKQTNFFVSKLLTGVLTHHLGWVSTVSPQISTLPRKSSFSRKDNSTSLVDVLANYLSKTQPYNALWGQLCELTGSIGYPSRVARTVVVGTDKSLLNHILTLLSYITRCSQVVKDSFEENDWNNESSTSSKSNASSGSSLTSVTTLLESNVQRNNSDTFFKSTKNSQLFCKHYNAKNSDAQKAPVNECFRKNNSNSEAQDLVKVDSGETKSTKPHFKGLEQADKVDPCVKKTSLHSPESNLDSFSSKSQNIQGLTASKTMTNLAAAFDSSPDSSAPSSLGKSPSQKPTPTPAPSPSPSLMYPNLRDIEDHKETFGPAGIQPDVIAEKVQKLFRVPDASPNFKSKGKPEIKVSGEKIDLEIEKGGKVLFILGEDERLEGLKPKKICPTVESNYNLLNIAVSSADDSKKSRSHRRTSTPEPASTTVDTLPVPVDFRRLDTFRMQGKSASAVDVKSESVKPVVYPSLTELKKTFAEQPVKSLGECKSFPIAHRRNMSDPTNGAFLLKMPPYQRGLSVIKEKTEASKRTSCHSKPSEKLLTGAKSVEMISQFQKHGIKIECSDLSDREVKQEKDSNVDVWAKIDEHSKVIDAPNVKLRPGGQTSLQVAESLLGGVLDHYSSIFAVHATTRTDRLEDQLRADLLSAAQHPVLNSQTSEAVAIVAETGRWEVELVSSHSYPTERRIIGVATSPINYGGIPVMISPLVSQISDSLLNLIKIGTPPHFIIQCLEHHLRGVYLKSQLLSEYLIGGAQASLSQAGSYAYLGGQSLYNLSELTRTLGIDVNDLPLLLSVASTHTPSLTQMFGLTFK